MKFGATLVTDAGGAILAHTLRAGDRVLKKGRVLTGDDLIALAAAGHQQVTCARLDPGELDEDAAAAAVAAALPGAAGGVRIDPAHTGRANLFAATAGLVTVAADAVARVNAVDEAITLATLPTLTAVRADEIIATVKIIPFAVPGAAIAAAAAAAAGALAVRPWRPRRAGLVLTRFATTADRLVQRAIAAQRARLHRCGGAIVDERQVAHDEAAVAAALAAMAAAGLDPILALGASAIVDRRDVIPAALERAGGTIVRLGMPVDPGNLLLLGRLGAATMIGLPGCARSEKRSGFDWVLERVCADVAVDFASLAAMGIGGLLEDVAARPAPRLPGAASGDAIEDDG